LGNNYKASKYYECLNTLLVWMGSQEPVRDEQILAHEVCPAPPIGRKNDRLC